METLSEVKEEILELLGKTSRYRVYLGGNNDIEKMTGQEISDLCSEMFLNWFKEHNQAEYPKYETVSDFVFEEFISVHRPDKNIFIEEIIYSPFRIVRQRDGESSFKTLLEFDDFEKCKEKLSDMRDCDLERSGSIYFGSLESGIDCIKEKIEYFKELNDQDEVNDLTNLLSEIKNLKMENGQQIEIFQDYSFEIHDELITSYHYDVYNYFIVNEDDGEVY